ncbi:hypothetical protein PRIPAC_89890 [Pristionchus pacificus]|uniref:Uncharacterized protein n=1 Tax=Pristionchus pacificus TaxID=54126 RepID=A0A2A6CX02_PRIPA|nr:hypothetical protein PRIPAC_89890 [Pristionchus pacificus]|eukprot:PDM82689.1 hypothetical protein PRIPAC_37082 [Pristionchus pacificus]
MGFQVGIKYSTTDPFPQLGIKQAYVPAASSTYIAYKPYSDCLRARVRLTICGPRLDRLLDVTSPHGRTIPRRFQTIPQDGIKHFPQVAIKLDSNLWELLDSKLIPDTGTAFKIRDFNSLSTQVHYHHYTGQTERESTRKR